MLSFVSQVILLFDSSLDLHIWLGQMSPALVTYRIIYQIEGRENLALFCLSLEKVKLEKVANLAVQGVECSFPHYLNFFSFNFDYLYGITCGISYIAVIGKSSKRHEGY